MEITIGASVYGPEGDKIGEVGYVVCDAQTQQVTHVVVSKGWLLPRDIVVGMADVESAEPDAVRLRLDADRLEQQPDFIEEHYVAPDADDAVPGGYPATAVRYQPIMPSMGMSWYVPSELIVPPPPVDATANVPPGSVTLDDGMDIWAGDDKVGTLAGVRMHPRTEQVSHLVVSAGGLMAEERLVPRRAIATIDAQGIHLALTPDEVHRLPGVETT